MHPFIQVCIGIRKWSYVYSMFLIRLWRNFMMYAFAISLVLMLGKNYGLGNMANKGSMFLDFYQSLIVAKVLKSIVWVNIQIPMVIYCSNKVKVALSKHYLRICCWKFNVACTCWFKLLLWLRSSRLQNTNTVPNSTSSSWLWLISINCTTAHCPLMFWSVQLRFKMGQKYLANFSFLSNV